MRELLEEWQLTPDGEPTGVLPVRTSSGLPAVLRTGAAEHEHLALQHWQGTGAVRLLRADPHRSALLLERLHPEDLSDLWDVEACEIVAGLYERLHVPAPPTIPRLSDRVQRWADQLADLQRDAPLPRRLVEQAVSLGSSFAADDATDGRLVHTDLHYANVLAGDREPWLAIAPKPLSGDPHFEVAPLLWSRWDELSAPEGQGVRRGIRARFHAAIDAAGLDEDRARDWVVVRMVVTALRQHEGRAGPVRRRVDDGWLTVAVTVVKAVQD